MPAAIIVHGGAGIVTPERSKGVQEGSEGSPG
jgi:hypothetical protein